MSDEIPVSLLTTYLREGETLLWSGQPNPACYQAKRTMEVKSLLSGGGALICVCGLVLLAVDGINPAVIFCLALGGVFLLGSFAIREKLRVPEWWYALTDQRVFSNYPTDDAEEIWQLSLKDISRVKLKKHEDGRGTLSFDLFFHSHVPLECIDDAETVCALIDDAKSRSCQA